jgi:transposase
MIQVTPQMRVLVAIEPADFRKGIDGLARVCRKAVKILVYDGQGFWLCQKRLSKGRFQWWPQSLAATEAFQAHQLAVLLSGGNPAAARGVPPWRRVDVGP